jgi:uncharacterized secreted protein with C-terminal beta-propeller domain
VAAAGRDSLIGGAGRDRLFAAAASDRLQLDAADRFEESKRANPVFQPRNEAELRRLLRIGAGGDGPEWRRGDAIGLATPSLGSNFAMNSVAADHSGTNNQVAGVEEADIVKTDGRFVYAVVGGELLVIDADPTSLAVLSRTPVPGHATGLFVGAGRVTVVSNEWSWAGTFQPFAASSEVVDVSPTVATTEDLATTMVTGRPMSSGQVVVSVFELADPAAPVLVERTELEGTLLAA